jgi:hypothetical protein
MDKTLATLLSLTTQPLLSNTMTFYNSFLSTFELPLHLLGVVTILHYITLHSIMKGKKKESASFWCSP